MAANNMRNRNVNDGYIIIRDKCSNKDKDKAYLEVDASASGYGLDILRALAEGSVEEWVARQRRNNRLLYGDIEPNKEVDLSWLMLRRAVKRSDSLEVKSLVTKRDKHIKDWDSGSVMPYGYVYLNGFLFGFRNGKQFLVATQSTAPKFILIMENLEKLRRYLFSFWEEPDEKKLEDFLFNASLAKIEFLVKMSNGAKIISCK